MEIANAAIDSATPHRDQSRLSVGGLDIHGFHLTGRFSDGDGAVPSPGAASALRTLFRWQTYQRNSIVSQIALYPR